MTCKQGTIKVVNSNGIDPDLKHPASRSEKHITTMQDEKTFEIAEFSGEFGCGSPRFLRCLFFVWGLQLSFFAQLTETAQ